MRRNYKSTLEERLSRLERIVSKRRTPKNEALPAIFAKIAPNIIKNLPAIISAASKELPGLIEALESDTMNDNTEKVNALKQFKAACDVLGEMFK